MAVRFASNEHEPWRVPAYTIETNAVLRVHLERRGPRHGECWAPTSDRTMPVYIPIL
jgi:hypothetical protein